MKEIKVPYGCANIPTEYNTFDGVKIVPADDNGFIYWRIMNGMDGWDFHELVEAMEKAIAIIQPPFRPITFKQTTYYRPNTIQVWFCPKNHRSLTGCPFDFDGEGGVLAHAFWNYGGNLSLHLHVDTSEDFRSRFDLPTVLAHELFHNLGFDHSDVVGSIMEAFYRGKITQLHPDDEIGVKNIYGDEIIRVTELLKAKEQPETPIKPTEEPTDEAQETLKPNNGCAPLVFLLITIILWLI